MKKLNVEDFLKYTYTSSLAANKRQSHFAFISSKADIDNNNYQHTLHISDGKEITHACALGTYSQFFWETDTTLLVPYAECEHEKEAFKNMQTVLYRYNMTNRTFKYAHTLQIPLASLTVIDENIWMITSALNSNQHTLYQNPAQRKEVLNKQKENELFEEITTIPFYADGGTFTQGKRLQLFNYNPQSETYTRVFDVNEGIAYLSFNQEIQKFLILANVQEDVLSFFNHGYTYCPFTNKLTQVFVNNQELKASVLFAMNDSFYLLGSRDDVYGMNANSHFYKVTEQGAQLETEFGFSTSSSVGNDVSLGANRTIYNQDNALFFLNTYKDKTRLLKYDGTITTILEPNGAINGYLPFNDSFILNGLFDTHLQEIYVYQDTVSQLSHFNDFIHEYTISKPLYHQFTNDGVSLDGWVLLPHDYNPEKKYPAILDIHGGPKTIYSNVFYHEMQAWVNQGYIVFYCNPRGGDSYDDAFADIRGKYGTIDYEDIMAFTDYVLETYSIDETKVGVTGGSYGGFMTNWIVSHTNRFAAAATQRSISNWISFYGTSDIGYFFQPDQTGCDPIDEFEKAWDQSPLKYAYNIKTPLLFIHSDADYRCPIEQAMQLYTTIKKNGVETRFIWFKNESHGLSRGGRPKARLKRLQEITNWMNQHLK